MQIKHLISHFFSLITLQQWFYVSIGTLVLLSSWYLEKNLRKKLETLSFPESYKLILKKTFGNISKFILIIFILFIIDEIEEIDATAILRGIFFLTFSISFIFKELITDFTAGCFILFSKPFKIGEELTITIDDNITYAGKITAIDIRYTTIFNTIDTILIPNSFIFKSSLCISNNTNEKKIQNQH